MRPLDILIRGMKRDFKGNANKGGIYQIRNIENGKIYIGSAKSFKKRAYQHSSLLKTDKHTNSHLQASWNKHGKDAFVFEVLEVVPGKQTDRIKSEQKYINQYLERWEECFNLIKKAALNPRNKFNQLKGRKVSDEVKRKISTALKGNKNRLGLVHTKKTKDKISRSMKKRVLSEEHKKKLSLAKKGKPPSDGTLTNLRKMAIANRGKPRSEEVKNKIRQTLNKRK